jgi:hypothetical protein
MLDEREWATIEPLLYQHFQNIKEYRRQHRVSLPEAIEKVRNIPCAAYEQMTGFKLDEYLVLFHHRRAIYGEPCEFCGRLLRTPQANWCAACGKKVFQ